METILVKSRNTLTLPPQLSRKYGIQKGVKILFEEENDHIKIFPISKEVIDMNIGILGKKGRLLKALMKEKAKEKKL
jgi:bifunctional DNA-binding transcriptional regulator/antitoxin component of YhaV-PrlF toxin-antitoxin module